MSRPRPFPVCPPVAEAARRGVQLRLGLALRLLTLLVGVAALVARLGQGARLRPASRSSDAAWPGEARPREAVVLVLGEQCQAIVAIFAPRRRSAAICRAAAGAIVRRRRAAAVVRVAVHAASTSTKRAVHRRAWRSGHGGQARCRTGGPWDPGLDRRPVARRGEPRDVTDRCDQRCRRRDVDAGDRHQPLRVRRAEHELRDLAVDQRDLRVEKVDLAQAALDGLLLLLGELVPGQPGATGLAEQIADRPACRAGTARSPRCTSFLARVR